MADAADVRVNLGICFRIENCTSGKRAHHEDEDDEGDGGDDNNNTQLRAEMRTKQHNNVHIMRRCQHRRHLAARLHAKTAN